jgi:hypothetical protein
MTNNKSSTLSVIVLFLLATAQVSAAPVPHVNAERTESVTLAFQERSRLFDSKLNVHFVGYRDDRCPSNVQCVWAGEAQAFFWVSGDDFKPQVVTVTWDGSLQPDKFSQRVGPYLFYLLSLEPRPIHGGKVNPQNYKAVLQVSH